MIPAMRADVHVHFADWQVLSDEIMQLYLRVRSISFGTRSEDCWCRQINGPINDNGKSRVSGLAKERKEGNYNFEIFV